MSLQERVNKIKKARKIQQRRIEESDLQHLEEDRMLEKQTKPITSTLQTQKVAIEDLTDAIRHQPAPVINLPAIAPQFEESMEDSFESADQKWVQKLYFGNRKSNTSKTTQFELNMKKDGLNIGTTGHINVADLFNDNRLIFNGKEIPITEGLAALILLSFDDITRSTITVTENDEKTYYNIMKEAGFKPSTSAKFNALIKPNIVISGQGLFPYSDPKQLENKLVLLLGSVKAGNTSSKIKSDIRTLADELLRLGQIAPHMHKIIYKKSFI